MLRLRTPPRSRVAVMRVVVAATCVVAAPAPPPPRTDGDALDRSRPRRALRPDAPVRARGTAQRGAPPHLRKRDERRDLGRARRLGRAVRAPALARPLQRLVLRRARSAAG